jgi:hypothetical protein
MSLRTLLVFLAVLTAAVPLLLPGARACAPVPPKGQHVEIAEESAIILWDAGSKTQHFIRRASFTTSASDFGFLVPTPSEPELAEASDQAFALLEVLTAPQIITQRIRRDPNAKAAADLSKGVRVLQNKRVGGYDAVVLEADHPSALADWLRKHDYASSPDLTGWLGPYVAAHWKVTAFKIANDVPKAPGVATSAVRMSFTTERPFFPYREPADQRRGGAAKGPRLLRVYFLGSARMQGTLGEEGEWPGQVVWAGPVAREHLLRLLKLPEQTRPAKWWLTEFEDRSSPRPGTDDVYFTPSALQSPVARPPVVRYIYRDEEVPEITVDSSSWTLLYALLGFFLVVIIAVVIWMLLTRRGRQPKVRRRPPTG